MTNTPIHIEEKELIKVLTEAITEVMTNAYNELEEGINVRDDRKVTMTDEHEYGVDTSLINNPTCTKDIIPNIEVWSIFKRKDNGEGNANPLIYAMKREKGYKTTNPKVLYKRINEICEKYVKEHGPYNVTVVVPTTSELNKYIVGVFKRYSPSTTIIDDLVAKMTKEEVDDWIYQADSLFRRYYKKRYPQAYKLFKEYCSRMAGDSFRYHLIKDMEMRKVIDKTIKVNSEVWGDYSEAINDKHVLVIDDSVTTGRTIGQVCNIIGEYYEPSSITVLTLFSPLYNSEGNELVNK